MSTRVATPTLRSEFIRGFELYNLSVALIAAVLLGTGEYALSVQGILPVIVEQGAMVQALATGLVLFTLVTLLHILVHAYFGWRFERGVAASEDGDLQRALQLLAVVERPGIEHYDLNGTVRALVRRLRASTAAVT